MIDLAINHEEELKKKYQMTWFNEKYKYYYSSYGFSNFTVDDNTYTRHQFVSLNKEGEVLGYIGYCTDRERNIADGLNIINFSEDKITFGMDVGTAIMDIFTKFHFRKLSFYVIVGNPIEKTYDKMVSRYNGRIVGIKKDEVQLFDGKYYDMKLYEILENDFIPWKRLNNPVCV